MILVLYCVSSMLGTKLVLTLDLLVLSQVYRRENARVRIENRLMRPRIRTRDRLREAAADDPFDVFGAVELGAMSQRCAVVERGLDESLSPGIDFALRKGPELERLDPSRQGIREGAQTEDARRTREEILARRAGRVDDFLDRQEQIRNSLDLVDHHQSLRANELEGVCLRSLPDSGG